jgi:Tol biopolymer transport system component
VTRVSVVLAVAAVCAAAGSAAPAPTGKIVFSSASGVGGKTQIWVMNANGSRRHSLSPATVYEEGPAVSRDGRRIAFGRRGDIYVMSS